jgi:ATP-dependent Clp protease ATP-binding subunit ClpA
MNGYNFTDRVRKVLQMAREEAASLHHEYVGTEHILLGMIREGEGVGLAVLINLKVDPKAVLSAVESVVPPGTTSKVAGPDLPYTSRAKKVLELSMTEARDLGHSYVGSEHLLLGLLREERGIAAQALGDFGVRLEQARAELIRLLGDGVDDGPAHPGTRRRKPLSSGGSGWGIAVRGSTLLLVGGILCAASGVEALRYAPNPIEKTVGVAGVLSGLLMLLISTSFRRLSR